MASHVSLICVCVMFHEFINLKQKFYRGNVLITVQCLKGHSGSCQRWMSTGDKIYYEIYV